MARSKKLDPGEQQQRFVEAARKLGCDEDEARFDEKLGKLAKPKPKPIPDAKDKKTPE